MNGSRRTQPRSPRGRRQRLTEALADTANRRMDRLYPIRHQKAYGIYSGLLDRVPTLVNKQPRHVLVLSFAPTGELRDVSGRPFETAEERDAHCAALVALLEAIEEPIRVSKFYLDEFSLGIRDYPSEIEEALEDLSQSDYDDEEELEADVRLWESSGQYVLDWYND